MASTYAYKTVIVAPDRVFRYVDSPNLFVVAVDGVWEQTPLNVPNHSRTPWLPVLTALGEDGWDMAACAAYGTEGATIYTFKKTTTT